MAPTTRRRPTAPPTAAPTTAPVSVTQQTSSAFAQNGERHTSWGRKGSFAIGVSASSYQQCDFFQKIPQEPWCYRWGGGAGVRVAYGSFAEVRVNLEGEAERRRACREGRTPGLT